MRFFYKKFLVAGEGLEPSFPGPKPGVTTIAPPGRTFTLYSISPFFSSFLHTLQPQPQEEDEEWENI